jgi:hypothetical protein
MVPDILFKDCGSESSLCRAQSYSNPYTIVVLANGLFNQDLLGGRGHSVSDGIS